MVGATKLQTIKLLLNGMAEYFRTTLTPTQLAMYAEDLEDIDLNLLGEGLKRIRRNPKHAFFPLPAAIREEIFGSHRDEALECSNRLVEAISKYGWCNPARARNFIGELGWRIVEREGGWENICRSVQSYDELGMRKAQWRELAAATLRRGERGADQTAPKLVDASHVVRTLLPDNFKKDET